MDSMVPDPPLQTPPPGSRHVLVRAVGGARGHRMDTRRVGDVTVVSLQGEISERFHGVEVGRRLRGEVLFDLAQVDRITSFGVREWLTMLRELYATRVVFARCSEPFMHQLSMIRSFAGNASIASFFAPYVCPACGTQFSALYDGVGDRAAVEHRAPVAVECPRCDAPATFDDDPALYLSVEHHLVRGLTPGLEVAVGQLDEFLAVPIRKAVVGHETWITLSTRLDESLRLHRALHGVEGTVVFDLSAVSAVTAQGGARFLERLSWLGTEVDTVRLVGCPWELLTAVLEARSAGTAPTGIEVASVQVSANCADGRSRRWVLVDLQSASNLLALRRGRSPRVAADWVDGTLDISDALPVLRQAADLVAPAVRAPAVDSLDPPPMRPVPRRGSGLPVEAFANSVSSMGSVPRRLAPGQPTNPRMANAFAGAVAVPSRRPSGMLVGALALVAGVLIGTAGLAGGMLLVALEGAPALHGPQLGVGAWEGAPAWVATRFERSLEGIDLVGTAAAGTIADGLRLAEQDMIDVFLGELASAVQLRGGFDLALPRPTELSPEGRTLAARLLRERVGAVPARVDGSVERSPWGVRVAARYALAEQEWSAATDYFSETAEFRGITVSRAFPTLAPRIGAEHELVVVGTRAWMRDARPGDVVVAVDDRPVRDLSQLQSELQAAWRRARSGEVVRVEILRGGQVRHVPFVKP